MHYIYSWQKNSYLGFNTHAAFSNGFWAEQIEEVATLSATIFPVKLKSFPMSAVQIKDFDIESLWSFWILESHRRQLSNDFPGQQQFIAYLY